MGRDANYGTTGGALALDLARLRATGRRGGTWRWSLAGQPVGSVGWSLTDDALTVSYSRTGDDGEARKKLDRIPVVLTDAGFGGTRQWLLCACGRRCRVVYVGRGGTRCRSCYRLRYQSQRESAATRAMTSAGRLVARLGGDGEYYDEFPRKPKRMHWRTYLRLERQHDRMLAAVDEGLLSRMARGQR